MLMVQFDMVLFPTFMAEQPLAPVCFLAHGRPSEQNESGLQSGRAIWLCRCFTKLTRVIFPFRRAGFQVRHLELTCLHLCRESRGQVPRHVRVEEDTPRTLWCVRRREPYYHESSEVARCTVPEINSMVDEGGTMMKAVDNAASLYSLPEGSTRLTSAVRSLTPPTLDKSDSEEKGMLLAAKPAAKIPGSSPTHDSHGEGGVGIASGNAGGIAAGCEGKEGKRDKVRDEKALNSKHLVALGDGLSALCGYRSEADDSDEGEDEDDAEHSTDTENKRPRLLSDKDVDSDINSSTGSMNWNNTVESFSGVSKAASVDGCDIRNGTIDTSKRQAIASPTIPNDRMETTGMRFRASIAPSSRVPAVRVKGISWCLRRVELLSPGFQWPKGVESLSFWPLFEESLKGVSLPEGLQELTFGFRFNASLKRGEISWPPGLKKLVFGARWNRNLSGAKYTWPSSLEVLRLGAAFNRPLVGSLDCVASDRNEVGLPSGLREIDLGRAFNQPLAGVEWPVGLEKLTLSESFNLPLRGCGCRKGNGDRIDDRRDCSCAPPVVHWPKRLREITFGQAFDQDISKANWPESVEALVFGKSFSRPLHREGTGGPWEHSERGRNDRGGVLVHHHGSYLPQGLINLELGDGFSGLLSVIHLPRGLQSLKCDGQCRLPSPIVKSEWPPGLSRLVGLGGWGYAALSPNLEVLRMDNRFNSPLSGVLFPTTLRVLELGDSFDHPLVGEASLPDGLAELRLGTAFKGDIAGAAWRLPRGLKRLVFSESSGFNKSVSSCGCISVLFDSWC